MHLMQKVGFYIIFLTPSVSYLLSYALVIWSSVVYIGVRHFNEDDPESQAPHFLRQNLLSTVVCSILFWILQKRELKNFFTYLDARQKEEIAVKKEE